MKFMTKEAADAAEKIAGYALHDAPGFMLPLLGVMDSKTPAEIASSLGGGHLGHHLGRFAGTAAGGLLTRNSDPATLTSGLLLGHDLGGMAGEVMGQYGGRHLVRRYNAAQARHLRNRQLAVAGLGGAAALGGLGLYNALSHGNNSNTDE